ncbi:MAG: hypothetical protein H6Q73_2671 [Firmicutes bacterium]|nr:hypothetical protein [Bacillota bacterium]
MIVEQLIYYGSKKKEFIKKSGIAIKAQMVLVFGSKNLVGDRAIVDDLRSSYPGSYLIGCSTSGEIFNTEVANNTLTATAICFEKTPVEFASVNLADYQDDYSASEALARMVPHDGLRHVFLLSEGVNVNGSRLVAGLRDHLPANVTVTGGLAGDGSQFKETYVIANNYAEKNVVALAAFYGDNIKIGYGSVGGWDTFGIERLVTRSKDNVLYELDGKPVLDLYKEYLGEQYSKMLPLSAFYFPLSIRSKAGGYELVRTILGLDEAAKSLTFAGNIPEGYYAKLMKANTNSLINGALHAAEMSTKVIQHRSPKLAILISCVGRKLVLKQRVDDEVDVTREVLGQDVAYTGFYSYGEISHSSEGSPCELYNQTMTITTFAEV